MSTVVSSLYRSRSRGLTVRVRPEIPDLHPTTRNKLGVKAPRLVARFGIFGPEQRYYNQITGQMDTTAPVIGGFFDLDEAASQANWSDDDKELVRYRLDEECRKRPDLLQRLDYVIEPAPLPWPTYDTTEADQVATLAETLGLATEALRYEYEHENRETVVDALKPLAGELHDAPLVHKEYADSDTPLNIGPVPSSVREANARAKVEPGESGGNVVV